MSQPGRSCPLHYRYGAAAVARAPVRAAKTLYVIGGLYGNRAALDAIDVMASAEADPPTRCFNGDFNWFDVDDAAFAEVNRRVLAHDATLGNVEAEFDTPGDDAGCGCAYPEHVDAGIVERSNRIHARLKATASRHAELRARIAALPMLMRYRVGDCRVGVVHGDADSLAGWRFDPDALDEPASRAWVEQSFEAAAVDVFASTHTCAAALRVFDAGVVVNNGAAGMPNFAGERYGLFTRIATTPSPHPALQETRIAGAYVAMLPLRYDHTRWQAEFLAQWPPGTPAWTSYFDRIANGPQHTPDQAIGAAESALRQVAAAAMTATAATR